MEDKTARTCYTWMQQNRSRELTTVFDEEIHSGETDECNPETQIMRGADVKQLRKALEELPIEYRKALVLRELEGLSYKEIADVVDVPIGTVYVAASARPQAASAKSDWHHAEGGATWVVKRLES